MGVPLPAKAGRPRGWFAKHVDAQRRPPNNLPFQMRMNHGAAEARLIVRRFSVPPPCPRAFVVNRVRVCPGVANGAKADAKVARVGRLDRNRMRCDDRGPVFGPIGRGAGRWPNRVRREGEPSHGRASIASNRPSATSRVLAFGVAPAARACIGCDLFSWRESFLSPPPVRRGRVRVGVGRQTRRCRLRQPEPPPQPSPGVPGEGVERPIRQDHALPPASCGRQRRRTRRSAGRRGSRRANRWHRGRSRAVRRGRGRSGCLRRRRPRARSRIR